MSIGLSIKGDAGNLILDENSVCYEFVGEYSPIAQRLDPNLSAASLRTMNVWEHTHYIDVFVSGGDYPLVFMSVPTLSAPNGVSGGGAAVLGVKYLGGFMYRVYLVVSEGYICPAIRIFKKTYQNNADSYGLTIKNAGGETVFRSSAKMLWTTHVGSIVMPAAYSPIDIWDEAEPASWAKRSVNWGVVNPNSSICCNTRPMCYRGTTGSGEYDVFYHFLFGQWSGELIGRWVRTYRRQGIIPTLGTYKLVVCDPSTITRQFALIDNNSF